MGGTGRVGNAVKPPVIGDVILHDKLPVWTSGSTKTHYHTGMAAGDNTLNQLCSLQIAKVLSRHSAPKNLNDLKSLLAETFEVYVKFMTTAGTHNDTYADSFHRLFFSDWRDSGKPVGREEILKFVDNRADRSNISDLKTGASLTMTIPWICHFSEAPMVDCIDATWQLVRRTHCAEELKPYVTLYTSALYRILHGESLKKVVEEYMKSPLLGGDNNWHLCKTAAEEMLKPNANKLSMVQQIAKGMGIACYIEGSLRISLFIAYVYSDNLIAALLANANCGGDNCGRGPNIAALVTAELIRTGGSLDETWKSGLHSGKSLLQSL